VQRVAPIDVRPERVAGVRIRLRCALDPPDDFLRRISLERERVLAGFSLAAQFGHGARDAPLRRPCAATSACALRSTIRSWNEKLPGAARAARGRDETGRDQRTDGAARQVEELSPPRARRTDARGYFFAAFFAGADALRRCFLGGLACFAGFFSRLARSASMRSITCAPRSGASVSVISWPSTFFCTAASMRSRTSSLYARDRTCSSLLLDQLLRELELRGLTSVFGISMSLIERTSPA
jgi:hypothetical protein